MIAGKMLCGVLRILDSLAADHKAPRAREHDRPLAGLVTGFLGNCASRADNQRHSSQSTP